jgi:capsular polysaccharide biosynthesis protein
VRRSVLARILLDSGVVIVLALILGGVGGLLYSKAQPRIYEATARVMVIADRDKSGLSDDLANAYLSAGRVRNYRSLLTSPALLERSISFHGLPTTATYLEKNLTVTSPRSTSLIDVTISAPNGQLAADSASAIAQEFVAAASELEQAHYLHVALIHGATVPTIPAHPTTARNVVNAGLALAVASAAVSVFVARRDPKLRYLTNVKSVGGVEVIGNIPIHKRTYLSGKRSEHRQTSMDRSRLDEIAERLLLRVNPEPRAVVELVSIDQRLGALMTDMLVHRLAEDRVSVTNVTQPGIGAVAVEAPPAAVRVGIVSSTRRWKVAAAFARDLKSDNRRALVVIVDGV